MVLAEAWLLENTIPFSMERSDTGILDLQTTLYLQQLPKIKS